MRQLGDWRLPGCTLACWPRAHDPEAHEQYGRELERETQRRSIVRTGPLVIDLTVRTVTVEGTEIQITRREYGVLEYLTTHVGAWCSKEEILRAVWGPEWVTGLKARTGGRVYRRDIVMIAVMVNRLRTRLGAAAYLIETKPGLGGFRRLKMEEPRRPTL